MPLHRIDHGDPDGRTVVLVHGSMDRGTSFLRAMRHVEELHTVAYDRRGYGRSVDELGPGQAPSVGSNVDDLLEVVGDGPVAVVGHSYGGVIALAAAARRPDVVASVGAFEPPLSWMPWWPQSTAGSAAVAMADPGDAAEAFLRRMLGDERWEALPETTRQARRREGRALVGELGRLRDDPPPFAPADVRVPVVVGYGTRGRPHAQRGVHELAESIAGAELRVFDGAAHGAHLSHPAEFGALIRRVADRVATPPPSRARFNGGFRH